MRAAVALVVLLLVPAPVAAVDAAEAPGPTTRVPPAEDESHARLLRLGALSVQGSVELTRDLARAAGLEAGSFGAAASAPTSGRTLTPVGVGDLDGDGLDDLLVGVHDVGGGALSLEARRGLDGALLWRHALEPGARAAVAIAMPDAPGGVVVASAGPLDVADATFCAAVCVGAREERFEWRILMLEAATGATRWARALDAHARTTLAGPMVDTTSENVSIGLWPDGDTLVLNAQGRHTQGFLARGYGEAIRASDGATLVARALGQATYAAALLPMGDASLDGRGDLLWTEYLASVGLFCVTGVCTRGAGIQVEAIDAARGDALWRREVPLSDHFVRPAGGDLTGDGRADVFLNGLDEQWAEDTLLVSGADGRDAWPAPLRGHPMRLGPIGGAPGDDLLVAAPGDHINVTYILRRVDGATGATLFETRAYWDGEWGGLTFAGTLRDMDGDGIREVHAGALPFSSQADRREHIESGATGQVLHALQGREDRWLLPVGDLDGGGLPDILVVTAHGVLGGVRLDRSAHASEQRAAPPLWTRVDDIATGTVSSLVAARDVSGDGKHDLLRVVNVPQGAAWVASIEAISGATGTTLWTSA